MASAVFTDPPIATVGLSEAEAARVGLWTSTIRVPADETAFAGGSTRTYMKLVVDGHRQAYCSACMIGADAPESCRARPSLTCGATKRDFDRTVAVPDRSRGIRADARTGAAHRACHDLRRSRQTADGAHPAPVGWTLRWPRKAFHGWSLVATTRRRSGPDQRYA